MSMGLLCIGALLALCGGVVVAFQVMFSPVRALVAPCALSEVPGLSPSPADAAVEDLGFAVFDPFGVRAVLRSFEGLGFQPSGAVVVKNAPVPNVYVVLLTRSDADARLWIQPDGTPGRAAVCSATQGIRVITTGTAEARSSHDKEEVEALPEATPMALVHRHEERMVGRTALEHRPDGALQRYLDEWRDDRAAMMRRSLLARAIGTFWSRSS
jgi:hypothetical protein